MNQYCCMECGGDLMEALTETLNGNIESFTTKMAFYLIAGIVIIVIVSLLLDGIRRYIRGLDTAALGALFLWLGYKLSKHVIFQLVSTILLISGGTLFATGLLVFIIMRLFRRKRAVKSSMRAASQRVSEQASERASEKAGGEPAEE